MMSSRPDSDVPPWLFQRSPRDGQICQRGVSVGAEELRQLPRTIAVSSGLCDEARRAQECQDVSSSFRIFEQVDSRLHGLGW
jgi:hypothetical protein